MVMGKKVRVYFDDGEKVSLREGIVSFEDQFSVTLDYKHVIPRGRIVRMEVFEDGTNDNRSGKQTS